MSLGTFKPAKIIGFEAKPVDISKMEEKKKEILAFLHSEMVLFDEEDRNQYWEMAESIPYRFYYEVCDDEGVKKRLMIEDWELFALFLKLKKEHNEKIALEQVRKKYFEEFSRKDLFFFLGTRMKDQVMHHPNPYSIIGVFYPPRDDQYRLF